MRGLFRLSVAALVCALPAMATAQGQTQWQLLGPPASPEIVARAQICPRLDMDVTGNFFCLGLGCDVGQPARWQVYFVGAGEVPETVRVTFAVDNMGQAPIPMRRADQGDIYGYSGDFDATRDAALIAALGRGQVGLLSFDTPWLNPASFALTGAAQTLQTAVAQCAAQTTAVVPMPGAAGPRARILAEVARACGAAPDGLIVGAGFETQADITGDGIEDLIYNYGALTCPSGTMPGYCGSGGCSHAIWAGQADGSHREVFHDTIFGLTAGWMAVLSVEAHGSACGRTGASGTCTLTYRMAPDGTLSRLD